MEELNAETKMPEMMHAERRGLCTSGQFGGVIWKYCVGLVMTICMSFILKAQPVISSFSPTSGPVGTTVTITGSGFSATATDNIVYFGAVKATVTSGDASSIVVTVPSGASYSPVSVTAGALTATSSTFYTPTYVTCLSILTAPTPFVQKSSLSNSTSSKVISADVDGDGKPDLVTFNTTSVYVFMNTTTDGSANISFSSRYSLSNAPATTSQQCYGGVVKDLDGDGKPDIALVNTTNGRVLVYHNESTAGNVSFSSYTIYTGYTGATGVAAGDFNSDGKPDLAVIMAGSTNTVSFLKNTSTSGTISFTADGSSVSTGTTPAGIVCGDFDQDGKVDIAVSNTGSNSVSLFRNTTSGTIAFTAAATVSVGSGPTGIAVGDLDANGKTDLVVVNEGANTLSFLTNNSSSGSISFSASTFTSSGSVALAGKVAVGDLDGDSYADVVVGSNGSSITCFKNISSGSIAFDPTPVSISTGTTNSQPVGVCIGDFNADSQPDLADVNANSPSADIYVNSLDKVSVTGISPSTGVPGTTVVLTGTGLNCVQSVTIGGIAAPINSQTAYTLSITAGSGNTGDVVLVTSGGTLTGPKFTFVTQPSNLTYAPGDDTTVVYGTAALTRTPSLNDGGGGITYTIDSGAVAGITINSNTGQIGWTGSVLVNKTGYVLKILATNSAGSTYAYITIKVIPDVPKDFSYYTSSYTTDYGTAGTSVAPDVSWMGETGTFSIASVSPTSPAFTIDAATGVISWADTLRVGTFTVTAAATNSAGTATTTITVTIKPLTPDNLTYTAPNPLTIKYGAAGSVSVATINWHGETGTYAITDPTLPTNITINTATGKISWNATLPVGTYTIPVVATNSAGSSSPATVFTLIVEAEAPTNLTYTDPVYGDFSSSGSTAAPTINWHGSVGTYAFSSTVTPPTGVTIDATTGIVAWPSTLAVGSYSIAVVATNTIGASNIDTFTLIIRPGAPTGFAYDSTSVTIPYGTVGNLKVLSTLDWHGQTGTFSITATPTLPAGLTINSSTGAIKSDGTVPVGTYTITAKATNDGGSATITIPLVIYAEAPTNLVYNPNTYTVLYGKADSIPVLPTINWHGDSGTYTITVVPTPAAGAISVTGFNGRIKWSATTSIGTYTITVKATNSVGAVTTTYTLIINPDKPSNLTYSATTITKIVGQSGSSVAPTVSWNGETGTFIATGTNANITLNATTGVVSFNNSLAVGTYTVDVQAQNSAGVSNTVTITIIIKPLPPSSFSYPYGGDTAYYSYAGSSVAPTVDLGGGTGTYSITTSVSPEISIDPSTGIISWTGNIAVGVYTFTVSVANATSSVTTTFVLTVLPGAPTGFAYSPNSSTLVYGNSGSSVTPTVDWHGETGSFAISNAPTGVTINSSTGVISWSSTVAAGTYTLNVTAANSTAPAATTTYTLKITPEAPTNLVYTPAVSTPDAGVGGNSATPTINWHGEQGTFTIVNSASISSAITIDATTGVISWATSLNVGTYSVQVQATNSAGSSAIVTYVITVAAGNPTITYTPPNSAVLVGGTGQSVVPVIVWNSATNSGSIDIASTDVVPSSLITVDHTTGQLFFDATTITTPGTYSVVVAIANTESKQGFATYKFTVAGIPTNLVYSTVGYTTTQGTPLTSVTPTVNWNGLTGTFQLTGAPAGVTIDAATGVITFGSAVASGDYNFTVTAVNSLGSSNSVSINLTVVPQADATISGDASVCAGSPAKLTVTLTGTAPWSFTYTDGTNSNTISGITSSPYLLTVTPTVTTTYTLTAVSDLNTSSTTFNSATDHATITITGAPVATIDPINACLGNNVDLNANSGTGYTYLWSNGGTTQKINVTSSGNYTVTVTNTSGCSTTSAPLTVTLNTIPTAVLNTPATTLICEGSSLPLTASGGATYNWYKDGVLITDSTNATLYATAEGSYTVDAVSAAGCTTKATNSVTLTFAKKPIADFTYDSYCKDVEITFTNNSDDGGGDVSYRWQFTTDDASSEKDPTYTYTVSGAQTISLTVTSKVCTTLSDTKSIQLTIEEPTPSQRYEAINALIGRSITLKALPVGTTYAWTPATGLNDATIADPVIASVKDSATYLVTVSTDAGCVTVDTQQVRIFKGADIFVPKAFTPNNDGVNDRLYPIPVGVPQITYFRVFNRWGVLLYETHQAGTPSNGVGWDGTFKGKQQPFDTYTWVAEGIDIDGKPVKLSGNSVLIR